MKQDIANILSMLCKRKSVEIVERYVLMAIKIRENMLNNLIKKL